MGWLISDEHFALPIRNELSAAPRDAIDGIGALEHVLLIDHHDSFTQLIRNYLEQLGASVSVVQSGDVALEQVETLAPTRVVLSPGPGAPESAAATQAFILQYYRKYPMLGICLGHQCLMAAFQGQVVQATDICHGKSYHIHHAGQGILSGVPTPFFATRYHSLVASNHAIPRDWEVTAWTYDAKEQFVIMGVQHQTYPLFGLQYHPEAILTQHGRLIFKHFFCF